LTSRDVRALPYMPLLVSRLLGSVTWKMATGDEAKAMVNLWACSWHELPGGSLPAGERELAALSGAGKLWPEVRDVALRGFEMGEDGRLHHAVIVGLVDDALATMAGQQTRTAAATKARMARRAARAAMLVAGQRDVVRDVPRDVVRDVPRNVVQREREQEQPPYLATQDSPPAPKKAAKAKPKAKPELPAFVPPASWAAWKRERKAKLTPGAVVAQLKLLAEFHRQGHNIAAVIQRSIDNGWATFYAPKDERERVPTTRTSSRAAAASRIIEDAYGQAPAPKPDPAQGGGDTLPGEWKREPTTDG
jgi:hypothetical protein